MARWFVDRLPERGIPSVSLRRLLPEAEFLGPLDWEVSGCCDDHRRLDPGQLFVAVADARPGYDGHRFLREALDRGAAGVVVEHPCPLAGRLQVVVPDTRAAYAKICQALSSQPDAGDSESIVEGQDFEVRIARAHTHTALGAALLTLRAIVSGRIHCVLSSDGGGDRALRRRLGSAAEHRADRVILTLSNPRTEDPGQILSDLLAGFHQPGKVEVEPDRRSAIERALAEARSGDAVLIAGNGRNGVQIFADRVIPFDDQLVATQWLRSRRIASVNRSA
jgi:UDP-N-acetylmuramoyl-L-alanyl-D-glutamate--2,6-diaminopimelate ligase